MDQLLVLGSTNMVREAPGPMMSTLRPGGGHELRDRISSPCPLLSSRAGAVNHNYGKIVTDIHREPLIHLSDDRMSSSVSYTYITTMP